MYKLPDKATVKACFQAAQHSYPQQAIAQQQINTRLMTLLKNSGRTQFSRVLEIGCGTGNLTQRLLNEVQIAYYWLNDLYQSEYLEKLLRHQFLPKMTFLLGDIEQTTLPPSLDLIIAASTVQWLRDKEKFIHHCAANLNEQGILLFNSFAVDNLTEIKQLTGIGLDYPQMEQWRQWLKPHFHLQYLATETISLTFDSPLAVLQHLRATGVTATHQQIWTKRKLMQFIDEYQQRFITTNGQVSLTYRPLYVVAVKKSSQ